MGTRAVHADALHQAGRKTELRALFVEAEAMQAELQPSHPLLYSIAGFCYCDWLLADAERAAWRLGTGDSPSAALQPLTETCRTVTGRATRTLTWMQADPNAPLLTVAIERLTLARAALYAAILDGQRPGGDHLREAVDFLRRAGQQQHLPGALLTRALFRAVTGDFSGAREDLDEAYEIAERGPMKLHLADIHLHRARLFGLMKNRPAAYPWASTRDDLDAAKKLIDECSYGRRREELADAEAAYQRLSAVG